MVTTRSVPGRPCCWPCTTSRCNLSHCLSPRMCEAHDLRSGNRGAEYLIFSNVPRRGGQITRPTIRSADTSHPQDRVTRRSAHLADRMRGVGQQPPVLGGHDQRGSLARSIFNTPGLLCRASLGGFIRVIGRPSFGKCCALGHAQS